MDGLILFPVALAIMFSLDSIKDALVRIAVALEKEE